MSAFFMVLFALKGACAQSPSCINFNVASDLCEECDTGFLLSYGICLLFCPTGFLDDSSGGCSQDYSSLQLINTKFYEVTNLSGDDIGDFAASSIISSDPVVNFVPTLDRGCYSHKSSFIYSYENIFLSPHFTLKLYIKPTSTGLILSLENVLKLDIVGSDIRLLLNTFSQSTNSDHLIESYSSISMNNWLRVMFSISADTSTIISIEVNINSVMTTEYFTQSEIRQLASSILFLGDSTTADSMSGFYYLIELWNEFNTFEMIELVLNNCDYLDYFDGSQCLACDPICGEINCVRGSDCVTCPFSPCDSCSGFSVSDCSSCDNGESAPYCCDHLCSTCSQLGICSACHTGSHLTFDVCVPVLPSGYVIGQALPNPIIDLDFTKNTFTSYYGSFTTSNYPKKVRSRGDNFTGNSTLIYSSPYVLAVKFSIVLLLKTGSDDIMPLVIIPGFFSMYTSGDYVNATLDRYDGQSESVKISGDFNDFEWIYFVVIVDNDGVSTTFSVFINTEQRSGKTNIGLLRMNEAYLYLGTDTQDNFVGFLSRFKVYIGSLDLYGFEPVKCASSWDVSCIEDCPYLSYLENSQCSICPAICTENCVRSASCKLCYDPNCDQCQSFMPGSCSACKVGYQELGGSCSCSDVSICGSCDPSCLTCSGAGIFNCLSCSTTYKRVHDGFCLSACPSPCTSDSTTCICSTDQVFDLRFKSISFNSLLDNFISGSSGSSYDDNDPLMQDLRGAYFKSSSYIRQDLVLSQIFLLNLWVKIEVAGSFIRKNKFNIDFQANGVVETGFWMSGMRFTMQVTVVYGAWINLKMTMDVYNSMNALIKWYQAGSQIGSQMFPASLRFEDYGEDLYIGQAKDASQIYSGFQGFLFRASMYLGLDRNANSDLTCTCFSDMNICESQSNCLNSNPFHFSTIDPSTECDSKCITCSLTNICLLCYPPNTLSNGLCDCDTSDPIGQSCNQTCRYTSCYPNCLTCDSCSSQFCNSCSESYFLILSTCSLCPSGYFISDSACVFNFSLILDLKFENNSTFSPQTSILIDESNPKLLHKRGAYFNQNFVFTTNFTLSPQFILRIWFYSEIGEGCLFARQEKESLIEIIKIFLKNDKIVINATASDGSQNSINGAEFKNQIWNLFSFEIGFVSEGMWKVGIVLNKAKTSFFTESFIFDFDPYNSLSLVGAGLGEGMVLSEYFEGFVYRVIIMNSPDMDDAVICGGKCFPCFEDGTCLSTCEPDSSLIDGTCQKCTEENKESCLTCGDYLCEECADIFGCKSCANSSEKVKNLCTCNEGFTKISPSECKNCSEFCIDCTISGCKECGVGYYLEGSICYQICDSRCEECYEGNCNRCGAHSRLVKNECLCEEGYDGEKCTRTELYLNISVSFKNDIILIFSDYLEYELIDQCIMLELMNNSLSFDLFLISKKKFKISPLYIESVEANSILLLKVTCEIISKKNSKLLKSLYPLTLNSLIVPTDTKIFTETKSTYQSVSISAVSSVVAISIFNPNLASLWSFMSTMQLLCFMYLFNIPTSDKTKGLLVGLKKYNFFPNILEYFDINPGKAHKFTRAELLGFKKNSIFMNTGSIISMFAFGILIYFVGKIAHKLVRYVNKSIFEKSFKEFFNNYKYSFFLRFWIQNYFDVGVACGISLFSADLKDVEQAYSFFFASLFMVVVNDTPLVLAGLVMANKNKIKTDKSVMSLYGSLFYEFKDDQGAVKSHFYSFYFLRRLVIILSIFLLSSYPTIQICIFEIFTLSVLCICLTSKPFSEPILNYSNSITELLICLIGLIFFGYLFEERNSVIEVYDIVLSALINLIVITQVLSSFIIFGKTIKSNCFKSKAKIDVIEKPEMKINLQSDVSGNFINDEIRVPEGSFLSVNHDYNQFENSSAELRLDLNNN